MAAMMRRLAILLAACALLLVGDTAHAATPQPVGQTGWRLTFSDEFNNGPVNRAKWVDTLSAEADSGRGNLGNGQLEWNTASNCTITGNILRQTAKPANIVSPTGHRYKWQSCLLASKYQFKYGYVEVQSRMPSPSGFWPTFWTWQAPGVDRWNETDVYEYWRSSPRRLAHGQHTEPAGSCWQTLTYDPAVEYHVYGANISATGTRFYVDGRSVCWVPGTHLDPTNIVLSNFVHSRIPPAAGATGTHHVNYVRVWQR